MRHLLEDLTSSVTGQEEPEESDDGLTPEEKTQLRELCVLIVISEFLERNSETGVDTARPPKPKINFTTEAQRTLR